MSLLHQVLTVAFLDAFGVVQDKLFKGHKMSVFNQMLYVNLCSALVSICGKICSKCALLTACHNVCSAQHTMPSPCLSMACCRQAQYTTFELPFVSMLDKLRQMCWQLLLCWLDLKAVHDSMLVQPNSLQTLRVNHDLYQQALQ